MPKIPVSKNWKTLDDDAAKNFEQVSASNVRQATSARVMENLAHGVNHLAARNPRPMFGKSQSLATVDADGANPLYEWRYNDSVGNGERYDFTVVKVPRTSADTANAVVIQWEDATHYDGNAVGGYSNVTVSAVNAYYDASFESIPAWRAAGMQSGEIVDGISTAQGYTALHVGAQERPLYWLDTGKHIYCDPTLAKKGSKVLADAAEDVRETFHDLRTTNLPIVARWSEKGQTTADRNHSNVEYANLFDTDIGNRNTDTPGATYDAQYCGNGNPDQRAQANVKVLCRFLANATMGTLNTANVMFWGPLGNVVMTIPGNGAMSWHGNADHFVYLDANVAGTLGTDDANKIDFLAAVHCATTDVLNWKAFDCWVDYE